MRGGVDGGGEILGCGAGDAVGRGFSGAGLAGRIDEIPLPVHPKQPHHPLVVGGTETMHAAGGLLCGDFTTAMGVVDLLPVVAETGQVGVEGALSHNWNGPWGRAAVKIPCPQGPQVLDTFLVPKNPL